MPAASTNCSLHCWFIIQCLILLQKQRGNEINKKMKDKIEQQNCSLKKSADFSFSWSITIRRFYRLQRRKRNLCVCCALCGCAHWSVACICLYVRAQRLNCLCDDQFNLVACLHHNKSSQTNFQNSSKNLY